MENILVIGANGTTGRHIVELLNNVDRYKVKALLRKESQKQNFDSDQVEFFIGDLEKDFSNAFKNIDKVIFAAGSGGSTGDDKTIAVDQEGAKKAIDYAVEHNLDKFVMLSSMGTEQPEQVKGLEVYLKAKKEADEYLMSKDIPFSILQPGALTNNEPTHQIKKIEGSAEGSISREDVAYALVKCLNLETCKNKSITFINGDTPIDKVLNA
jgi:uncharacterized protein YbjT (DUF2867 family)